MIWGDSGTIIVLTGLGYSATISNVFKRHGGTALDTPVFELKEVLTNSTWCPAVEVG